MPSDYYRVGLYVYYVVLIAQADATERSTPHQRLYSRRGYSITAYKLIA